jgi:class 3 adenylate cyclase
VEEHEGHERKLATVLFADLTGSTGLGERLDVERLRDVMGTYFAAMRDEVEACGGLVGKFIGDAVMAVFGVPIASEDHADRALAAATGMRDRLSDLNAGLRSDYGLELEMRIGVNTGEILVPMNGQPDPGTVTGDVVNVAARLEQIAEPGQILAAERTVRASRAFRFRDVGALDLRGRTSPVLAFELIEAVTPAARSGPLGRAPLVGREHELTLLSALYERCNRERRPHLVTVYGPAGVGKSRLLEDFAAILPDLSPPPQLLSGRCLPYGGEATYGPLAEILKRLAGVSEDDPPDVTLEKIRTAGRNLLPASVVADPARATAALGYTVGVEDPRFDLSGLSPRQIQAEIRSAWRLFFGALAQSGPYIVLIEDIHWADPALLALLEDLADRVEGPVLFVCPARPELTDRRPDWGGGRRSFSSILLDPLTPDEADRLLALLLESEDLPPDLRDQILQAAEGNPFFIEEILQQLVDERRLVRSKGSWRVEGLGPIRIPDSVHAVLAARVDLLAPPEKRALQCASVVGRVFWTGALGALLETDPATIDEVLDRLEERELVFSQFGTELTGQREFRFKHVLTRDVAYGTLSRRERSALHRRVAEWMEATTAERRNEVIDVIAYHLAEAYDGMSQDARMPADAVEDLRTRAHEYLLLASNTARLRMALDKAKRLAAAADAIAVGDRERARTAEALGEAYFFGYEGDPAWHHLRESIDLLSSAESASSSEIARLCARALETPCRWPGTMETRPPEDEIARYLALGYEHAGPGDGESRARLLLLESFWPHAFPRPPEDAERALVSPAESLLAGREAADMGRRLDDPVLESAALDGIAAVHISAGDYGNTLPGIRRRIELAAAINDPWELGDIYAMGGWTHFHIGRFGEAHQYASTGFELTRDDVPSVSLHCLSWRGLARFEMAEWTGLFQDFAGAREILGERSEQPPHFASPLFAIAALAHEIRGETAAADSILGFLTAMHTHAEPDDRDAAPLARWAEFIAPLVARRGQFDEARRLLSDTTWRRGARAGALLQAECEIVIVEQAWDQAAAAAATARGHGEEHGLEAILGSADALEGHARLAGGDPAGAIELLRAAGMRFAALEANWRKLRTDLALAEALLAAGRSGEANRVLAGARHGLKRIGARRELERTHSLEA